MSQGSKVKAIRVPGGQLVRLETDLPFDAIAKVAGKHGLNWMFLVANPELGTGEGLMDLYKACCDHVGVVPEGMTARKMLTVVIDVDDDLPEEYEDDGRPKEGDPTTD